MKPLRELSLSQARISRAQANIKEFAQLLDEYLGSRPSRIRVEIDAKGLGAIRVERREPIPDQLSILLGEALQNLRAGLDNCLYAVAIIDSGTNPPPGASQLQWPIALYPRNGPLTRNGYSICLRISSRPFIEFSPSRLRTPGGIAFASCTTLRASTGTAPPTNSR